MEHMNNSPSTGRLNIHSENILPIIKKWLYSEHDIFIRELASNGSDAIQKRKILESRNELPLNQVSEDRIDITIDKEKNSLTVSDTGIGMTGEETEKYLSQIAFSGAEEFMKAYQLNDAFIGHFGLGFFSSFMVADKVSVITRSCREGSHTVVWESSGTAEYTVRQATDEEAKASCGTDVILTLNKDSSEFLELYRLKEAVKRFCRFFPVPVYVQGERINSQEPLWVKNPKDVTDNEYKELFRSLYPFQPDPLFWIHINVDYPFHVKGILYFPSLLRKDHDLSKESVSLYCNRVFVSDSCKDILPEYLTMMKGVIDSPDIPLNVSRSYLQVDRTVRQLAQHISKKVSDAISTLAKNDRKKYEEVWEGCELVVKLGMLEDEKFFSRLYDTLLFKTVDNSYKTISELLPLTSFDHEEKKSIVVYADPGQEKSPLISSLQESGKAVVITTSVLDHPLMSKIEQKSSMPKEENDNSPSALIFRRIDSDLIHEFKDTEREKTILDNDGKTEATKLADFFRRALGTSGSFSVEAKSLSVDAVPAILTMNEEERRFRDYSQRMNPAKGGKDPIFSPKSTLVINTNNKTVQSIAKAEEKEPELAREMAQYIVALTKLTQNEMSKEDFDRFVHQSNALLEHVAKRID